MISLQKTMNEKCIQANPKSSKKVESLCKSFNSLFHCKMKFDLWKSVKFLNRSGACIVVKMVISRSAREPEGALQRLPLREVGVTGLPDGGARGGTPPRRTVLETSSSLDAMYPLDTAD